MSARISSENNIPDSGKREAIDRAIVLAIGPRRGDWKTSVFVPEASNEKYDAKNYYIEIRGPYGFKWKKAFGPFEHDPKIIEETIASNLP